MKKMIYLTLCLAILLCLFTIATSAAEPAFDTMEDEISSIPPCHVFGDEHNATSEHHDGYYNEDCARVLISYEKDGTSYTVTYPSYYVLANHSILTWDFAPLSQHLGVELSVNNVVQIEIPYGITDIPERAFVHEDNWDPTVTEEHPYGHAGESDVLTYVHLPDTLLTIGDFAFAHCTALDRVEAHSSKTATGEHDHIRLHSIGYRAFHHCPISSFVFNIHLTHLGEGCFEGCRFTSINLSKCTELKVIPAYCFHESDAGNITEIILGAHIKEIGDYAFTGASAEKVFLGTRLEKIGHGALDMTDVDIVFLPVTITEVYSDSIVFGNKGYKTYIVGSLDEAEIEAMINVLVDSGTDYKNVNASGLLRDSKKYFANAGNDFCELYCGGHVLDANSQITGVEFPNGIEFEGVGYGSCGVCMQQVGATHLPPILVVKGYSVCTFNNLNAFTNGIEVYHDSLFAYETVNGPLELGFLFAVNDRYQSVDFYANIDQMNGACFIGKEADAEFTKEAIDFKVTYSRGLVYEDANGNVINRGEAQVVICAYGYENNTGKVHYVQDLDEICIAGKTEDGKYFTVSYDSIYGYIQSLGLE